MPPAARIRVTSSDEVIGTKGALRWRGKRVMAMESGQSLGSCSHRWGGARGGDRSPRSLLKNQPCAYVA